MIELTGQVARFLHAATGCGILGLLIFEVVVATDQEPERSRDVRLRAVLVMTGGFVLAGCIVFAAQLHAVAGGGLGDPAAWIHYAASTRFGATWLFQHGVAVLLFGTLAIRRRAVAALGGRAYARSAAILALLAIPASAFAGHSAADETPVLAVAINWIHIVAVGSWAGGLPVLLALSWQAGHDRSGAMTRRVGTMWRRFSRLALIAMSCLVASGLATAWLQVGGIPPLLGTAYGQLLLLKITVLGAILIVAAHLRRDVLPRIEEAFRTPRAARRLATWVASELLLVLAAIALGSALAGLPPARHDQIVWPLSIRFAPEIAWPMPGVQAQVAAGALIALAGALASVWLHRRAAPIRRRAFCALLLLAGLAVALPALTIPANPETYRRSAIPYDVFSIANGERLFRENCSICHGVDATGNGEAAASTPRRPADLTAPHARDHTAGDMFWWISQGIPASGMPGFSRGLAEDERWDLVNFIHTLAAGYQARMIRESIAPRNPWLAAPDFVIATESRAGFALQDFRQRQVVLLVLFSAPQSEARLHELEQSSARLVASGARVIAVSIDGGEDEVSRASARRLPAMGGAEGQVAEAYMLFRRTLSDQRLGETGTKPRHMEILIDLYGFIRARWVPEDGTPGWADIGALLAQIRALSSEGRVRDPPDAHLH
jgi:copper resistance protein D